MPFLGDRLFTEVNVKMRSLGWWAIIYYDWYPYKKGKFGYRYPSRGKAIREKTSSTNQGERPGKDSPSQPS